MDTSARSASGRQLVFAACLVAAAVGVGGNLATARPAVSPFAVERSTIAAREVPAVAPPPPPQPPAAEVPVREYLDAVFEVFAGRPAAPEDVAQWSFAVEAGDLGSLTAALAVSDEWAGSRVAALYDSALGRPVDAGGRAHWVDRVARGATLEHVAASLFGSTEYYVRSGSTDAGFVDRLYTDLLGRPADPGGQRFWLAELARGRSRASVAAGLYESSESRRSRVHAVYDAVLDRAPDPTGAAHWSGRVREVGDVVLASSLASSPEFFRRATGQAPPEAPARGRATGFTPFATAGDVTLTHPAAVVDVVGFHQSGNSGAHRLSPAPTAVAPTLLGSRGRGTDRQSAADVVVPAGTEIRAPVTGTVLEAGTYQLYCKYPDDKLVIEPDAHPGWRVVVLHISGVQVAPGERVVAGTTPIAPTATVLPFDSQVEALTPAEPWPHVHIEVFDPSVPDRAPGSGAC